MAEKDQICDYCKDVIFTSEVAIRIETGFFNQRQEFYVMDASIVRHGRCHTKIEARAITMQELLEILKPSEEVLKKLAEVVRRI